MPTDMASGSGTVFYYGFSTSPPKSFADWGALVGAFAADLVGRYGVASEVSPVPVAPRGGAAASGAATFQVVVPAEAVAVLHIR